MSEQMIPVPNTAWAGLPNAKHIDWVLADLEANQEKWSTAWNMAQGVSRHAIEKVAWDVAWNTTREVAWNTARGTAWYAAWDAVWRVIRDETWSAARVAARGAIAPLIAWDYSSKYLEMTSDELCVLDDPASILLLPAVMVRQKEFVFEV